MDAIGHNKTPVTNSQIDQINQLATDTIEQIILEFGLDAIGADNVIEQGEEFADGIRKTVIALLEDLKRPYKFREQEVETSVDYGKSGYQLIGRKTPFKEVLQDLYRQAEIISKLFGIKPSFDVEWARKSWENLPDGAEKLFLIPRSENIAPTYEQVCNKAFDLQKQTRNFYNRYEGSFGMNNFRQSTKSVSFWEKIGDEQKGYDILVVPAQFGIRHRGRSVYRACELMGENECGLSVFAVNVMLLTHPERLQECIRLFIDCSGDEFNVPSASARFVHVIGFEFNYKGRVDLVARWRGEAHHVWGSASMFL